MNSTEGREPFPVCSQYDYFNHAAISPLPRVSSAAMQAQVSETMHLGVHGFQHSQEAYAGLRRSAAAMLGCAASEIAIGKNTSEGICAVANGIDWRAGDVVVGLESDFPANYVPWRALGQRSGVRFRSLPMHDGTLDLQDLDDACKGARLAALSYVHFLTGFRWDLEAVGEICRRRGCQLVVDAVQGMGAFPINVKRAGVHALAASGHKWLLGPEGAAIFYIDRGFMDHISPVELGWASLEGFEEYRCDGDLQPDASRFECGTLNAVGCTGLRASIDLLNEIGSDATSAAIDRLVQRLVEGAAARGYEFAARRTPGNGSGIVSMRKHGVVAADATAMLLQHRVSVSERLGWVRIAPHFYNTDEQVDRLLGILP